MVSMQITFNKIRSKNAHLLHYFIAVFFASLAVNLVNNSAELDDFIPKTQFYLCYS